MKHIHFIAIGGAVMHQLAIALNKQGNIISGSDDEINDPAKSNLAESGLLPEKTGWFPEKITSELDAVVLGMHAKANNPELIAAKEKGIPIFSFPQYVYEVSKHKKRIVIAGSHGKTTITSMIMHILQYEGIEFDYLVGARVTGFEQSVKLSNAPIIILEGDEYPASVEEKRPKIFFYHPHISVVSGIAWDHINVFPTYENYFSQFEQYIENMDAGAKVYYNDTDPEVKRLINSKALHLTALPYRMPVYKYDNGTAILETLHGPMALSVFGSHNLLNMQAAIAVCKELGISEELCLKAIASFTGAARRLEKLFEKEEIIAFRDFAHAPSKLKATLNAVREAYPKHHLVACFELHTYSSLNDQFLKEYNGSMSAADQAIVYFSKHALELKGLPDLNTDAVKNQFGNANIKVFNDKNNLITEVNFILNQAPKPICLLLMSSGTFDGIDWNSVSSQ